MRLFLFAAVLAIAVSGCSDGKLNLLVVFWGDSEESSSSRERPELSSSSSARLSSSSGDASSSSSEKELPSSSSEQIPGSSSSSGSREARSSSAKMSGGYEYVDYPILEEGARDVKVGWATRYWDGCKTSCSWLDKNVDTTKNPKPWSGICKNCDKNNKEISTYARHPEWTDGLYWAGYLSVKSSCDPQGANVTAYTCWDMAPIAINDTLAYGFAAVSSSILECGTCYQLDFDGGWNNKEKPRPTQTALKGKTMIVMASNGGEAKYNVTMDEGRIGTQFDILIPGGGVGAYNSFSDQLGITKDELGVGYGGLLSNCLNYGINDILQEPIRDGSHRATLEQMQECLRKECKRVFSNKAKELYNGCLWLADWFMAADNPTLLYKKVECPQYLKDKYYSSIDLEPPPLPDPYPINGQCKIEGSIDCKQTGWY